MAEYGSAKWKAKRCSCTTELMGRYRIQCGSSSLGPPELLMQDGVDLVVVEGEDSGPTSGGPGFHQRGVAEPVTPFPYLKDVPTGSILCRICELEIPSWFFVKHNDTCNLTHRIEASVAECCESIVLPSKHQVHGPRCGRVSVHSSP